MNKVCITQVSTSDIHLLQHIAKNTFVETFASVNSEENMQHYLEHNLSIQQLSQELCNPNSKFYFIHYNNQIAGYLKLNFATAQTEQQPDDYVEIERIYVLKSFQGLKLGQALLDHAIQEAHKYNAQFIWLGVWEHNEKAIGFYLKNGFESFDTHLFVLGDDRQTDILMKKKID